MKKRLVIDLDEELLTLAEKIAKQERRSRKQVLELIIEKGLKK